MEARRRGALAHRDDDAVGREAVVPAAQQPEPRSTVIWFVRLGLAIIALLWVPLPALAQTPSVAVGRSGVTAVGWLAPDGGGRLAVGTTAATLGPPEPVEGDGVEGPWLAVEPSGAVRFTWLADRPDYTRRRVSQDLHVLSRRREPDGRLGPVQDVSGPLGSGPYRPSFFSVDVAADPDGNVIAGWWNGRAAGAARAAPGEAFVPVPAPVPDGPRVAVAGAELLMAGRVCRQGSFVCELVARDTHGGVTGLGSEVPFDSFAYDAAVAADGTGVVALLDEAYDVRVHDRPAGGTFGAAEVLGSGTLGTFTAPAALAAPGSPGAVAWLGGGVRLRGFDGSTRRVGDGDVASVVLAGSAPAVGFRAHGKPHVALADRDVELDDAGDAPAIAMTGDAVLAAYRYDAAGATELRAAVVDASGVRSRTTLERQASSPPYVPPPLRTGIPPGPVRVRDGAAEIPVTCNRPCQGTIRTARETAAFRIVSDGSVTIVALPVPARARRIRLVLTTRAGRSVARRRLARGPDRRACRRPPFARTLARSRHTEIFATPFDDRGWPVVVCRAGEPQRRIATVADQLPTYDTSVAAAAVSDRFAALAIVGFDGRRDDPPRISLVRLDLRTGERSARRLSLARFPGEHVSYPLGLTVSRRGAVAVLEQVRRRVRVRVVDAAGDRVVDGGPGIDEDSFARRGDTVRWTRDGAAKAVTLR